MYQLPSSSALANSLQASSTSFSSRLPFFSITSRTRLRNSSSFDLVLSDAQHAQCNYAQVLNIYNEIILLDGKKAHEVEAYNASRISAAWFTADRFLEAIRDFLAELTGFYTLDT